MRNFVLGLIGFCIASFISLQPALPQSVEPRIAFVAGNSAYPAGPLPNALNDAGLVAEALRSIGFDVVESADAQQPDFLNGFREFVGRLQAAGPDAIAFMYFSGYGLAFEGENFLVAANARIERDGDIPLQSVRLSDLLRTLEGIPGLAKVVMIDASRPPAFSIQGQPLAPGLAAIEAPQGMLVSFAAAPGMIAEDQPGDYGAYATAIAEMVRSPGLDLDGMFTRIRARVHQLTEARQTPWHDAALTESVVLLPDPQSVAGAAPPPPPRMLRETRPMQMIDPDEAYALAIEVDTLEAYGEFVQAFPGHPYAGRIYALMRARREALAWMRALEFNTPEAYWSYLQRYPNGIYAYDAARRLRRLAAYGAPPPGFMAMEFEGVPLPLPGEPLEYAYMIERGPPPPRILIEPRAAFFANLLAPRRDMRPRPGMLPVAVTIPAIARIAPAMRRAGPLPVNVAPSPRNDPAQPRWRRGLFDPQGQRAIPGLRRDRPESDRRRPPAVTTPSPSIAPSVAPSVAPSAVAPTSPTITTPAPGDQRRPRFDRGGTPPSTTTTPGIAPSAPRTTTAPGTAPPATTTTTAPGVAPSRPAAGLPRPETGDQRLRDRPFDRRGGQPPVAGTPPPGAATPQAGTPPAAAPTQLPRPERRGPAVPAPSASTTPATPPVSATPPTEQRRGPPPHLQRQGPPPPPAAAPPSPQPSRAAVPPPAAPTPPAARPAAPPPPPQPPAATRPVPPPPPAARAAPPPPPKPAGPPPQRKCPVVDGKEVCPPR